MVARRLGPAWEMKNATLNAKIVSFGSCCARLAGRARFSADQDGLQQVIQRLLGEARPRKVRQALGRGACWSQPHGLARLRRVPSGRRAGRQGVIRQAESDALLTILGFCCAVLPKANAALPQLVTLELTPYTNTA